MNAKISILSNDSLHKNTAILATKKDGKYWCIHTELVKKCQTLKHIHNYIFTKTQQEM